MDKFKHVLLLTLLVAGLGMLTACSDKDDEPTSISVSPSQITLLSDKNSTASLTITANKDWTLSNTADWLSVSASSGSGNTTVILTALSENASASSREATVTITSGESSTEVSVSQLGAFVDGCSVSFENIVIMTTSVAFKFDVGPKVDYFNFGWLKSSAAGWTDERIVEWLSGEDSKTLGADVDGIYGLDGMKAGTDYYLVAIAFDKQGNRGELTKTRVTTRTESNYEPITNIDDVRVNSSYWFWTTYPNARVQRFYMMSMDDEGASLIPYLYNEAELASVMKDAIDSNRLTPMSNSVQSWKLERSSGSNALFLVTWSQDVDGKFASVLNYAVWSVNANAPERLTPAIESNGEIRMRHVSEENFRLIRSHISVTVE